ncbi:NUDIX domain-containing protein [Thermomicrobium sp. 4228-Ro]|uniref:NUDIX hydrolase n=1 Tax=Thermomicrobium sp. 4228-Ro TaxID=2993937 RepID=UPI00224901EA|nr:NUDIX domain-containing protein [Thermomicrobium sp. 4228-Ro]MCX2726366.1 NUDIX domain-containing protein [Thermomicrobium sp. 4228-Ro]
MQFVEHPEPTTDPQDEPFDVLAEDGSLVGLVMPRGEVHRLGLWHPAFHLWIVSWEGDQFRVLLQRRSWTKDTMPGKVDVSVGGHFRAGEYLPAAPHAERPRRAVLRELREELGLDVEPEAVHWLGRRWSVGTGPGVIDREIQELYACSMACLPARILADHREVSTVYAVSSHDLRLLLTEAQDEANGSVLWQAGGELDRSARSHARLRRDDLIPGRRGYWLAMLTTLERWLRGEKTEPLILRA